MSLTIDIDIDKEIEKYKLFMNEAKKMPKLTEEQEKTLKKELCSLLRNNGGDAQLCETSLFKAQGNRHSLQNETTK